jgi:hypothetical protein
MFYYQAQKYDHRAGKASTLESAASTLINFDV